jgi:menaquinol-cytochrome c reductase iron-sulfur subunit
MSLDASKGRREFFSMIAAVGTVAMGALLVIPGVSFLLDPVLRSTGKKERWLRVAEFKSLSKERPVAVPVVGEQVDAWTRASNVRLGTVWLRVLSDDKVSAWNAECPHLGCKINYDSSKSLFNCPCHASDFSLDGTCLAGPSPRAMDPLPARIQDGHVEVRFARFRPQTKERLEIG